MCPLRMFNELTQRLRPDNWGAECHDRQGVLVLEVDQAGLLLFILVTAVVVCLVFIIVIISIKNYASRRGYYQRL